ncbi:MAG: DUF1801 domain-containing protein [Dehalococcoidia bacterium]
MSKKVDEYIQKQQSPYQEICLALRRLILETLPDVKEEMKWGVPAFADGKFYIVALKDHVNLGFSSKGFSNEETALFDGGGKTMRHIQIAGLGDIDKERITKLLKLVNDKK